LRRPSASGPVLSPQLPSTGPISPPSSPRPEYTTTVHSVLETHHIQRHHNFQTGNPIINNYEILGDIGAGVHGRVKKAMDTETGVIVAIKIINRQTKKRLGHYDPNEQEKKIKREIAIMKKCHHPNIVNLIEVIDNPNHQKVYLGTPFEDWRFLMKYWNMWREGRLNGAIQRISRYSQSIRYDR
jgi:serine/threonine protein kinase